MIRGILFLIMVKKLAKLGLFCILAAGANCLLNALVTALKIPLFLDTVFSCAIAFALGFVPGVIAALLTWLMWNSDNFQLFVLCSLAEVALVCLLKPKPDQAAIPGGDTSRSASFYLLFSTLLFLYITAVITVSVFGGLIDFFQYDILSFVKIYFSPEDSFKMGLVWNNIPVLAVNILARIPINIVDRFITIFGGYGIGRLITWFARRLAIAE